MNWVNLTNSQQYTPFRANFSGVDPHLIWAYLANSSWRTPNATNPIPVMFEANLRGGASQIPTEVTLVGGSSHIFSPFHTGFVALNELATFLPQVKRCRVGVVDKPSTGQQGYIPSLVGSVPIHASLNDVVIGLIDHGIAFANKQFATQDARGRWHSRIERVWDQQKGYPAQPVLLSSQLQTSARGSYYKKNYWDHTPHYGYGRQLVNEGSKKQINFWLNEGFDEAELYRHMSCETLLRNHAHGTHVLGLLAGQHGYGTGRGTEPLQRLNDAASTAKIIAVQLPTMPLKDTSGIGQCVQVLDAISYIALHAKGRKVVINLSDGAYGGPHDGTSLLESALDQVFGDSKRHAFVVAAGNQFDMRTHWQDTVPPKADAQPLTWRILPDDNTDSHLEIWPDSKLGDTALGCLQVSVTPPGQSASPFISWNSAVALFGAGDEAIAALVFSQNPPNAQSKNVDGTRAMVHLAVRATSQRNNGALQAAPHGLWTIRLKNTGETLIAFDAYIERDNPALGDGGPSRQSHFIHPAFTRSSSLCSTPLDDGANTSPIKRIGALNSIATAANVLVVGGYVQQTQQLASYSASGPGRAGAISGVNLCAPSDSSQHVRGIRSDGVRTGTSFRMDGTSVSAPFAARWIINFLASHPTPTADWRTAISAAASTRSTGFMGSIERIGCGRL